jgi:hypothetical protein
LALADQVSTLPGLDDDVSFNMFSGYLSISDTKEVFYW